MLGLLLVMVSRRRWCGGLLSWSRMCGGLGATERKLSPMSVTMVAMSSGVAFPARAPLKITMSLRLRVLRVKTHLFMNMRRWRHWRRALLGGAAYRDLPWFGSGGGWPVVLLALGGWVRLVRVDRRVQRAHGS
jgi:hypothetical protein